MALRRPVARLCMLMGFMRMSRTLSECVFLRVSPAEPLDMERCSLTFLTADFDIPPTAADDTMNDGHTRPTALLL
jgi:hypothetical protein